ncbi:GSCFA domain-containing protein [Reichenbachiella versicolor]|uniref:GSCFA domain-containing protein n=1 Tax=Reichenbachiella versicolor TaxID=1821036 RepID=UPI000D6E2570|nr:GSCFA domain-containing protein [Reichenbachiella versicolor]
MSNSLRTEFKIAKGNCLFNLSSQFLTIGSCFSDMIAEHLTQNKFQVLGNPFGTVYNPISLFRLLQEEDFNDSKFIDREGIWLHHDFHSEFRNSSKEELAEVISDTKRLSNENLRNADCLIITYGTAWIYETLNDSYIVSNCHKTPQKYFNKRLLSIEEMMIAQDEFLNFVFSVNSKIQVLLTLSPVRHTKDGIPENQLSKSSLRLLCDRGQSSFQKVEYFPSYEIMMDDLRDYRFYKDDLIHPTSFAENYIWEKFRDTYLDKQANEFIDEWKKITSALAHKPFNPESKEHRRFVDASIQKLRQMSEKVNVSKEIALFQQQLD